jgi:hypothetical protein
MAKIFKTSSQEQALKEIVDGLKIVTSLNRLLEDEDVNDCKVKVMGSTNSGNLNEQIPIPYNILTSPLKDYRKKLVKEISDKSKTYSIQLDDSEKETLGIETKKESSGTPTTTNSNNTYNDNTQPRYY